MIRSAALSTNASHCEMYFPVCLCYHRYIVSNLQKQGLSGEALGKGQASGKVILFGEHAVVYGRPALAVPLTQVKAEAIVEAAGQGTGLLIFAQDLAEEIRLEDAPAHHPLALAARLTLAELHLTTTPQWRVVVRSSIPIASGLGSGAAISAAVARALADAAGQPLSPSALSDIVYEVDKLHHGTPSGIDNSVISYEQPVYFVRGQAPHPFSVGQPFTLVIANSGIASSTRAAVADVRLAWERETPRFEALFDRIAAIVERAQAIITDGIPEALGNLMDQNHSLLQEIGVSSPALDVLAEAARRAGAGGAKLSGAGRGGNLIALVTTKTQEAVTAAMRAAGAADVIVTTVGAPEQHQDRPHEQIGMVDRLLSTIHPC
jgi:mevalonate kinase